MTQPLHDKEIQGAVLNVRFKSDFEKMRDSRDFWRVMTFGTLALFLVVVATVAALWPRPKADVIWVNQQPHRTNYWTNVFR